MSTPGDIGQSPSEPAPVGSGNTFRAGRRIKCRLSLRLAILSIAVFAIGLSWFIGAARARRKAAEAILKTGGNVGYAEPRFSRWAPAAVEWLDRYLEPEFTREIDSVDYPFIFHVPRPHISPSEFDEALSSIEGFQSIQEVSITDAPVTDAALRHLRGLTGLRTLRIIGEGVTDKGLENLRGLVRLQHLELEGNFDSTGLACLHDSSELTEIGLSGPRITDDSLMHLLALPRLEIIMFGENAVTKKGLETLKGLTHLKEVDFLEGSRVTEAEMRGLRRTLPGVTITIY